MNGDEQDICHGAVYQLHTRISRATKHFVKPISSPTQNRSGPSSPIPLYDGHASSADSGGSNFEPQGCDNNSGGETTKFEGTLPGGIPNNLQTPTTLFLPPQIPEVQSKAAYTNEEPRCAARIQSSECIISDIGRTMRKVRQGCGGQPSR